MVLSPRSRCPDGRYSSARAEIATKVSMEYDKENTHMDAISAIDR